MGARRGEAREFPDRRWMLWVAGGLAALAVAAAMLWAPMSALAWSWRAEGVVRDYATAIAEGRSEDAFGLEVCWSDSELLCPPPTPGLLEGATERIEAVDVSAPAAVAGARVDVALDYRLGGQVRRVAVGVAEVGGEARIDGGLLQRAAPVSAILGTFTAGSSEFDLWPDWPAEPDPYDSPVILASYPALYQVGRGGSPYVDVAEAAIRFQPGELLGAPDQPARPPERSDVQVEAAPLGDRPTAALDEAIAAELAADYDRCSGATGRREGGCPPYFRVDTSFADGATWDADPAVGARPSPEDRAFLPSRHTIDISGVDERTGEAAEETAHAGLSDSLTEIYVRVDGEDLEIRPSWRDR